MKLQRIFMLGCMVVAMGLIVSCSGEDGEDGAVGPASTVPGPVGPASTVPGPAGDDGINCWDLDGNGVGTDGTNDTTDEDLNDDGEYDALDCQGADGADGQGTTAERIIIDTSGLDVDQNPVSLEVAELTQEVLDTHAVLAYIFNGADYYPIPGVVITETILSQYSVTYLDGELLLADLADTGWQPSIYQEVHIILIPTTTLGAKSHNDVMSSLKDKGVDTSDYKEVVRYFGLDQ